MRSIMLRGLFSFLGSIWCWKHLRLKDRGLGCGKCIADRYRDNVLRMLQTPEEDEDFAREQGKNAIRQGRLADEARKLGPLG